MTALTGPMPQAILDDPRDEAEGGGRDPAHALYDEAARLLAAAHALEAAAYAPGAAAALPPTLACAEASLAALARVVGQLGDETLQRLSEPAPGGGDLRRHRSEVAARFSRLAGALEQSAHGCTQARRAIAPVMPKFAPQSPGSALEPQRGAGPGSIVEVVDRAGRAARYELVEGGAVSRPEPVAATSPTGRALWGARPGDSVRVTLPNGRERRVRVTAVAPR